MEDLSKLIGGSVLFIGGLFFFIIFSTLAGAVSGWLVGLIFGDTILGILGQLGVHNVTMFQFGAFMGFVGGFLKTKVTTKVTEK